MGSTTKRGTDAQFDRLSDSIDGLNSTITRVGGQLVMALQDVITALQASAGTAATAMTDAATAITDLAAEIKNAGQPPTQAQLDTLTGLATSLQTQGEALDAAAKAADPGPPVQQPPTQGQ